MTSKVQDDEIDALRAIYDEDFCKAEGAETSYSIHIRSEDSNLSLQLNVSVPPDYPSKSPPAYQLKNAEWIGSEEREHIERNLLSIFSESKDEVVVYQWVEWLRDYVNMEGGKATPINNESLSEPLPVPSHEKVQASAASPLRSQEVVVVGGAVGGAVGGRRLEIVHGEPLTDRKSTFQAHVANVHTVDEVKIMLSQLKSNKKIAAATHNILAYRIYVSSHDTYKQDCDDDGESAAGGRLLHLLQIMNVQDMAVVVTRWYGGIQLHADRFKHINNVARILIQESGIGLQHQSPQDKTLPTKSSKKRTKNKPKT